MTAQEPEKLKILVVGVNSHLGNELCNLLTLQNCELFALDDFDELGLKNFQDLNDKKNFKLINADFSSQLPQLPKLNHIFFLTLNKEASLNNLTKASLGIKNVLDKAVKDNAKFLLVSTVDVYKGVVSSTSLENYFGAEEEDFEKYEYQEASRFSESLVTEYFRQFKLDARIVRTSQFYGPQMKFGESGQVGKLIEQAILSDTLTISGDGLETISPLYIADLIFGINKAMFAENTTGKIFSLIGQENLTVLSFAYKIQEVLKSVKELEIKFKHKKSFINPPNYKIHNNVNLNWEAKTVLSEGLKLTFDSFLNAKVDVDFVPIVKSQTQTLTNSTGKKYFNLKLPALKLSFPKLATGLNSKVVLLGLIILFFGAIVSQPFVEAALGLLLIKKSIQQISKQNFDGAQKSSRLSVGLLKLSSYQLIGINDFARNNLKVNFLTNEASVVSASYQIALSINQLNKTGPNFKNVFASIFSKDENQNEIATDLSKIYQNLILVADQLSIAQIKLTEVNQTPFGIYQEKFDAFKSNLPIFKDSIVKAIDLVDIYPSLIGQGKDRKYLLIFQNNLEIRPTGGFIGSYGIVKFSGGKLKEIKVDDIYNLDGQLTQNIPPPEPLKINLGVDRWYLRDANWNPDFSQSAPVINQFYEMEAKDTIDAVVAIDVSFVQGILAVLGPVQLADYKEVIDSQNLFDKAEYYSEINFKPGSTAKKDFLSTLSKELIDKVMANFAQINLAGLAVAANSSLNEKHVLLWFKDPALQAFAQENNFAGQVRPENKKEDFLLIADANVGANKANAFVEKQITYQPIIRRDGDILARVEIVYKNNSPAETWPAGNYKNYLQILTPLGTSLESIVNGENALKAQVNQFIIADKNAFGLMVEVPIQKEVVVKLEYRLPLTVSTSGGEYQLFIQKQPGTIKDRLAVKVNYPSYLKPVSSSPKGNFSSQTIDYQTDLATDKAFKIKFEKN